MASGAAVADDYYLGGGIGLDAHASAGRGTGLVRRGPAAQGPVVIPDSAPVRDGGCPGGGFGARKADGAACRTSERLTSSARSGKAPACGGWTISGAAGCKWLSAKNRVGSTAWFPAAGPNPIRSWPDTNPAAAASRFRLGALLLSGRPQLQVHGGRAAGGPVALAGGAPHRRRERRRERVPGRAQLAGRLTRVDPGKSGRPTGRSARDLPERPGMPRGNLVRGGRIRDRRIRRIPSPARPLPEGNMSLCYDPSRRVTTWSRWCAGSSRPGARRPTTSAA